MAEHLLQQTLPPEMAVMADYYKQGTTPPTAAETAYGRYSRLLVDGQLPGGDALDELVKGEAVRIGESALASDGAALDADELRLRAVAAFIGTGPVTREEGTASLARISTSPDDVAGTDFEVRLEAAVTAATTAPDYTSAAATPRRDINPALAQRLGIDTNRGLMAGEVALLLNGQRADGREIEGKQTQSATLPLTQILGPQGDQKPSREQLERMLEGKTVTGKALPGRRPSGLSGGCKPP
ncbi:MAG TPA: hypothetical protein VL752_00270 [Acidisoma sp.]|uniref:hypothetical protein n=1 Tax=Acidisoma sp. TaxID=1872115 RepID=UPI002C64FCE1|nr:hypothetical protein [Acidisoma sp.]HTH99350.1 hypothetical protein [Acidisoma sp.]